MIESQGTSLRKKGKNANIGGLWKTGQQAQEESAAIENATSRHLLQQEALTGSSNPRLMDQFYLRKDISL